jgi:hypothetical protein
MILPRPAHRPPEGIRERCAAAAEIRVRAVNAGGAATQVHSPGGTTGSIHWYL